MKSPNAFSLLEIIVALFLFNIGIMAVASMQILARNQLSSATQSLDNSFSAVAFLEQLIGLDY